MLMLWLTLAASPALAQDANEDDARALYEQGAEAYAQEDYQAAIDAWQEAYILSGRSEFLFNIANAYERMGDLEAAMDYLVRYRDEGSPEQRDMLDKRIRELEKQAKAEGKDVKAPKAEKAPREKPEREAREPRDKPEKEAREPRQARTPRARGGVDVPRVAGLVLAPAGAALVVGGGVTAGATYGASRAWVQAGDQATYEQWRPVNAAGLAGVGVGVGLAAVGTALLLEVGPFGLPAAYVSDNLVNLVFSQTLWTLSPSRHLGAATTMGDDKSKVVVTLDAQRIHVIESGG